jgi:hypothetical protein
MKLILGINQKHFGALISIFVSQNLLLKFNALYDYSYLVNIAHRIGANQIPWKDFDLMVTPGAFYVVTFAFETFGYSHKTSIAISLISTLIGFYLFFEILKHLDIFKNEKYLTISCSIFSINSILAFPFYDNFAILAVLFSLFLLLRLNPGARPINFLILGFSFFLPFAFKQNIGVFFLFGVFSTIVIFLLFPQVDNPFKEKKNIIYLAVGFVIPVIAVLISFDRINILKSFYANAFVHAGNTKQINAQTIISQYLSIENLVLVLLLLLILIFPYSETVSFLLLTFLSVSLLKFSIDTLSLMALGKSNNLPFNTIGSFLILGVFYPIVKFKKFRQGKLQILHFAPFIASLSCIGAMTSQGFWGSNYAVWPLLALVIYSGLDVFTGTSHRDSIMPIFVTFVIGSWLISYGLSGERFSFVKNDNSISKKLISDWNSIPLTDKQIESLHKINEILSTKKSQILEVPMEDPLPFFLDNFDYWGRCPQLNVISCQDLNDIFLDFEVDPPTDVIIKKEEQLVYDPEKEFKARIVPYLENCFTIRFDSDDYRLYSNTNTSQQCIVKMNK